MWFNNVPRELAYYVLCWLLVAWKGYNTTRYFDSIFPRVHCVHGNILPWRPWWIIPRSRQQIIGRGIAWGHTPSSIMRARDMYKWVVVAECSFRPTGYITIKCACPGFASGSLCIAMATRNVHQFNISASLFPITVERTRLPRIRYDLSLCDLFPSGFSDGKTESLANMIRNEFDAIWIYSWNSKWPPVISFISPRSCSGQNPFREFLIFTVYQSYILCL